MTPPEHLLRALLLQVLYTVQSEYLLMERLDYNLLFRWCVGLHGNEPVCDHSTFSANRERFAAGAVAQAFFERGLAQARQRTLLSDEHFTADATLLEAWASMKSFRPKNDPGGRPPDDTGNPTVDFHGEQRSNATHQGPRGSSPSPAAARCGHEILRHAAPRAARRRDWGDWSEPLVRQFSQALGDQPLVGSKHVDIVPDTFADGLPHRPDVPARRGQRHGLDGFARQVRQLPVKILWSPTLGR